MLICLPFCQLIIACKKGGTSIEDLAEKFPDMIVKVVTYVFSSDIEALLSRQNPIYFSTNLTYFHFLHLIDRYLLMFSKELQMKMLQR